MEHALNSGLERVFILEDDVDFCPDFKKKLAVCLDQLPPDWDGLHLAGSSPLGCLRPYSTHLNKCLKSWGGYAYILNRKVIPTLLDLIKDERLQVDTYYTTIMPNINWFKSTEMLVYHLPGYSDIEQKHRDLKELYK